MVTFSRRFTDMVETEEETVPATEEAIEEPSDEEAQEIELDEAEIEPEAAEAEDIPEIEPIPTEDEESKDASTEDLAFAAIAGKFGATTDEMRKNLSDKGLNADDILDVRSKILRGEYFA